MKRMIGGLAAVLLVLGVARAEAGITDPLPTGFKYVYTVPGVINNLNVGTAFICTATDNVTVGVEVFDAAGAAQNSVGAGVALTAGQSVTFATQTLPYLVAYYQLVHSVLSSRPPPASSAAPTRWSAPLSSWIPPAT